MVEILALILVGSGQYTAQWVECLATAFGVVGELSDQ